MRSFNQESIALQTRRLNESRSMYHHQIDLLFTPYSSRVAQARSLEHPLYHMARLMHTAAMFIIEAINYAIRLGFYIVDTCQGADRAQNINGLRDFIEDPLHVFGLNIAITTLETVNTVVSTLLFMSRSLFTLICGYDVTSESNDTALDTETRMLR